MGDECVLSGQNICASLQTTKVLHDKVLAKIPENRWQSVSHVYRLSVTESLNGHDAIVDFVGIHRLGSFSSHNSQIHGFKILSYVL